MAESETADQRQLLVGVALTGSRKSRFILRWAMEKFLPEGNVTFKLIHVYPKITVIPTPMGTWVPVSQVREELVTKHRKETEWKTQKKLIPYLKILKQQKIKADIIVLESDDIPMALSLEAARQSIRHLVIGFTSASIFSMRNLSLGRGDDLSQAISENAPNFCSVYVIGGDGKLQQLRPAHSEPNVITVDDTSNFSRTSTDSCSSSSSHTIGRLLSTSSPRYQGSASTSESSQPITHETLPDIAVGPLILPRETTELEHYAYKKTNFSFDNRSVHSQSSSSGDSGSWVSDRASPESSFVGAHNDASLPTGAPPQRPSLSTPPTGSYEGTTPTGAYMSTPVGNPPTGPYTSAPSEVSPIGTPSTGPYASTNPAVSPIETPPTVSYVNTPPTVCRAGTPPSVSFIGVPSDSEAGAAHSKINELEKLRMELRHIEKMYEVAQNNFIDERVALKLKEEKGKELARTEEKKSKAAQRKTREKFKNEADTNAAQEEEETKNKFKELFTSPSVQYQKFVWEEIMEATKSLSDEFKIGMGAFGTVYKCKLHHTTVAVKVLHCKDSVRNKQFVQELEILSTIRHPHLLLLLGAVPEQSCLVYEYMDHGSLDDRLYQKNEKPPLPWYDRFRICYEVAGALAFLHSTTPRPIIHRDLKPANILLDHNLVSKIGDAGLGTMINVEANNMHLRTLYKDTSPVGTLCYIDPEYQRTGRVSTKSDVYALGVVILQVLTAKPAVGIAHLVEDAIDEGELAELLDPEAGEWPEKETLELAVLGLQCAELRGKDRPDLSEKILPTLERLKEMADSARESVSSAHTAAPPHYYCPILKDVMEDPCVAADGYTYERRAIEQWLTANDTSPTTNQPLPHKFVMPNNSLLDAIKHWKSKKQRK